MGVIRSKFDASFSHWRTLADARIILVSSRISKRPNLQQALTLSLDMQIIISKPQCSQSLKLASPTNRPLHYNGLEQPARNQNIRN